MSVEIARLADDKKAGMTFGDLKLFLAEAERAGIPDHAPIKATVGFKQQLQRIQTQPWAVLGTEQGDFS